MEVPETNRNFREEIVKIRSFVAVDVRRGSKTFETGDGVL